jgi:hypothetical protein
VSAVQTDRDREYAKADDDAAHDRRGHVCTEKLPVRKGRQQDEDQAAHDLRLDQARRRVRERVLQYRHHHQAGDQEGRVADAGERLDMRLENLAEHQQVKHRRQHRRRNRLEADLPETQHFLRQQRAEIIAGDRQSWRP